VILVVPNYDEARREFESRVKEAGVICKTIVIDEASAKSAGNAKTRHQREDGPAHVSIEAIERGDSLWL